MRRVVVTFLAVLACGLLAVTAIASSGLSGGTPAPASFRLADGSAGCRLVAANELACRTKGIGASVVLRSDGSSRVAHVDVTWTRATPVLRAGEQWWHAGFVCRVDRGRAYCTAGDGSVAAGRARIGGVAAATSPAAARP